MKNADSCCQGSCNNLTLNLAGCLPKRKSAKLRKIKVFSRKFLPGRHYLRQKNISVPKK
jgi:hypothetical protein